MSKLIPLILTIFFITNNNAQSANNTTVTTTTEATTTNQATTEINQTTTPTSNDQNTEDSTTPDPSLIVSGYVTEKTEVGSAKIYKIQHVPKMVKKTEACPRAATVYMKTNCTCPTPEPCPEVDYLVCDPCPVCEKKTVTKTIYHGSRTRYRNNDDGGEEIIEYNSKTTDNNYNSNKLKLKLDFEKIYKIYPKMKDYLKSNDNDKNIFNNYKQNNFGSVSPLTLLCVAFFNSMDKNDNIVESTLIFGKIYENDFTCLFKYRVYRNEDINISSGTSSYNKYVAEISINSLPYVKICKDGEMKTDC